MRYALLILSLLCLSTRPASSQAVAPLRPIIVTLDSGTVAARYYVAMDSATYRAVRARVADADRAEYGQHLSELQVAQLQAELRRCRGVGDAGNQSFDQLARDTRALETVKPRPPLLLDGHFYKGIAVGAVLLEAVRLFIFHTP